MACKTTERLSYIDVLKRIEIHDAPASRKCFSCGQTMHPVQVNPYIVFYVHNPEQFDVCIKVNPTGQQSPLIWCNKHIVRQQLDAYYEEVTGHKVMK